MSDNGSPRISIVEYGTKPADQFQANPRNPRRHPQRQRDAVHDSLERVGWIAPVIENRRTGNLLDGHERVWQALATNSEVPYVLVDVAEADEAFVLATFDPIGALAEIDAAAFADVLRDVDTGSAAIQEMLAAMAEEAGIDWGQLAEPEEQLYSRKIEAPIYEPTGQKPHVSQLYDSSKTERIVSAIERTESLSEDNKAFLLAAAQRHTVFNFSKIAEYYAHADAPLQELMEESGLVIIDIGRAIELGFVRLTEAIREQVQDEYGTS